jgi:hypothetical protein
VLITNAGSAPYEQDPADHTLQSSKVPVTSEKNNAAPESTKEAAVGMRQKPSLFPPPGFRSRNIAHMIAAVIVYLLILCVAANLGGFLDAVFFMIGSLSVIDICTNWTGAYARLAGLSSPNTLVRAVMTIFWSIVIFTAWIVIMVILEQLLF